MNELDQLRAMYAAVPAPASARLAAGRERLLGSISDMSPHQVTRRGRGLRGMRLVIAAGLLLAVTAVSLSALHGVRPRQAVQPAVRLTRADQVLRSATLLAASRRPTIPRPGQWIYTRVAAYDLGGGRTSSDSWLRFDGGEEAYYQGGRLIVHTTPAAAAPAARPLTNFLTDSNPGTAYRALASLPLSPQRLLAQVADQVEPASIAGSGWDPPGDHPTRAELEFGVLVDLLWNTAEAAPPRAEAAVFHAMATIAGVRAQAGVLDALGHPAIALSIGSVAQQLLLDPVTYQVVGQRTISNGQWPEPGRADATVPAGETVESLAWVRVAFVSAPGDR